MSRGRPARRPRRTTSVKSVERVSRADRGSTAPAGGATATTVRPTARRGPCDGERRGWPDRRGCACAAGSRASSPDGGCWAGRSACSRSGLRRVRGIVLLGCSVVLLVGLLARAAGGRCRPDRCVPSARRHGHRPSYGTERRRAGQTQQVRHARAQGAQVWTAPCPAWVRLLASARRSRCGQPPAGRAPTAAGAASRRNRDAAAAHRPRGPPPAPPGPLPTSCGQHCGSPLGVCRPTGRRRPDPTRGRGTA